ncbi:MAG: SDR family oxidoreductase [Hyphomicrobiaceae bacterium]|nr:SDR family oxidoreductase [Hyphomicrobiaceae bacterium]
MTQTYGMTDSQMLSQPTVYKDDLFRDRIVVVSGGGSGLGKATAVLFGRLGAHVVICGRDEEKLRSVEELFQGAGLSVEVSQLTIRDPEAVGDFFDGIWQRHGRLDYLVNNAGGQFAQNALEFSLNGWKAVVDTNLNGTWYMTQAAAQRWVAHGQPGSIVNVVADFWRGLPQMAHTAAARAGVVYMSKSVAVEWARYGIRINCMAPGCHESSAFEHYTPTGRDSFKDSNPMRRTGDEWDVAEAIVYLSAPSGKFITGEVLTVDGGQQCWGEPWPAGRPEYFALGDNGNTGSQGGG